MKMPKSLIIDPQFKNLIPPLQRTEYLQLEENLLADGCRDPLVVWRGSTATIAMRSVCGTVFPFL